MDEQPKRRRGRPSKGPTRGMHVDLPPELYALVQLAHRARGITLSDYVRSALLRALAADMTPTAEKSA